MNRGEKAGHPLLQPWQCYVYVSFFFSLFINDIKQTPDPPTWPHKVVFIVAAPSYRFYVAGTKYEQTARSDEVYWSTTTIGMSSLYGLGFSSEMISLTEKFYYTF